MARGYESPQDKLRRLAQKAINSVGSQAQKTQIARQLGFTLGTGRAQGFLRPGVASQNVSPEAQARAIKALETATVPSSNPRMASYGATQLNVQTFQQNLGESPYEEFQRRSRESQEAAERPFREAEEAERQAEEARKALERQIAEQNRIQAEVSAELAKAESEAKVAGRISAATSGRLRSQSMLEQQQVQQSQLRLAQQTQKQQKTPGATVGQPGRTRTRLSTGLKIGGYGGSQATRVSPTGLNI